MKNILFSTTCQWNPGDEFILHGVLNLLRDSGLKFNPLLYNRNPEVNPKRPAPSDLKAETNLRENSFDLRNPAPVDYVIFAGTPEWTHGPRVDPLLEYIHKSRLRCSFLGVGLSDAVIPSPVLRAILSNSTDVFVCRDNLTFDTFQSWAKAQKAPCPSILSSRTERMRGRTETIGCVIQGSKTLWQSIPKREQESLYKSYRQLAKAYAVEYIAHYIDDFECIPEEGCEVYYSGLSSDYYSIYDRYDLVISPRLHACGIAASLGVPSICLAHDKRGAAAEMFGSFVVTSPDGVDAIVSKHDWTARSTRMLDIKRNTRAFYQSAIQPLTNYLRE